MAKELTRLVTFHKPSHFVSRCSVERGLHVDAYTSTYLLDFRKQQILEKEAYEGVTCLDKRDLCST